MDEDLRAIWDAYISSGAFSNDDGEARSAVERMNPSAQSILRAYFTETPAEVREYVDEMNRPYDHAPSAEEVWRSFLARILLWLGESSPNAVLQALQDYAGENRHPAELAVVWRTLA